MTDIYHILDYNKQGTDIIKQVFTNSTFRVQRGHVHDIIHIIRLKSHFVEYAYYPVYLGTRYERLGEVMMYVNLLHGES